jgi:hypothetical protein
MNRDLNLTGSEAEMSYCFRYRVRMLTPIEGDRGDAVTLVLPELPSLTATVDADAYPAGRWVIFKACGFETDEAARLAGEQFGETLLVAGALTKLGIDLGFSRSTLQFSEAFHQAAQQVSGRELRSEVHGLMTFEENTIQFIGLDARASSTLSRNTFEDHLRNWKFVGGWLTERQRNCASLLNDSFFVSNTEGQFVLRISAVEALCDQTDVGSAYKEAIQRIEDQVVLLPMDDDTREAVRRMLANARRESVGQSYLRKFRKLCTDADAKAFHALYGKRSKFLHDGFGRGDLTQASNKALQLAVDLLEAELRAKG